MNLIEFIVDEKEQLPSNSLIQLMDNIPYVDYWIPRKEDEHFKTVDKAIILNVSDFYNSDNKDLDYFCLSPKRCYNKPIARKHFVNYLNYFEKFFDPEHELLAVLYRMKFLIDYDKDYTEKEFRCHLKRFIFRNPELLSKLYNMNEYNYCIPLVAKKGKSIASLQYTTKHGKILMMMSMLMVMTIPLICHYMYVRRVDNVDGFILKAFDEILNMSDVDIASKFYETASTEVYKNYNIHIGLWKMQDIRGKNVTTHSMNTIENIILNIMPRYVYKDNLVSFNFKSIKKSNGYKVTDIKYEYNYTTYSSSNRDENFNSDFDKFESNLIREDEALYIQNKVASEYTMQLIRDKFGPFPDEQINLYRNRLQEDCSPVITKFQKKLIFNIFYKYFGDPTAANAINQDDYIALMLAAKKILLSYNMIILPYIVSGRVIRIPNKKSINNKELTKIQQSPLWKMIQEKYQSPKIESDILSEIACLIASEFKIIEPDNPDIDGKIIDCISDIVAEEYLLYVLLI